MVGLFKQKSTSNIVMLFILAFFLKLPIFFSVPKVVIRANDGPFYQWIAGYLSELYNIFPFFIAILILILHFSNALLLSKLTNNNKFMNHANYLSGMAYIIISSFVKDFNTLSAPLLSSTFILLSFINIYKVYHQNTNYNPIFNSGFLLAIGSLIFTPAIILAVGLYIALAVLKAFKLNEWFILLAGIICPFYFYGGVLYLIDQWQNFDDIFKGLTFGFHQQKITFIILAAMFLMLMPLLVGVFYTQANANKLLIHVRKGWVLIFLFIIISIIVSLCNTSSNRFENWVIMLPFVAMLHGYGFKTSVIKIYPKIFFWLSIGLIIASYFI